MRYTFIFFVISIACLVFFTGCTGLTGIGIHGEDGGATGSDSGRLTPKRLWKLRQNGQDLLLVDIRPTRAFHRGHLPGAFSMPACDEKKDAPLNLPQDRERTAVVYCGWSGCGSMAASRARLESLGFSPVLVLEGGTEAWQKAGYPLVAGDDLVLAGKENLLIDLRPAHKDTVQRIPGSLSIPFPKLPEHLSQLPRDALLVLYGDSWEESREAVRLCRDQGFEAVMVEGNIQGWRKRGLPLESGPVRRTIRWQRKLPPGAIDAATLEQAAAGKIKGAVLLDVRTDREVSRGRILGSVHIPLNTLAGRVEELSSKSTYFVYASDGPRAEVAMHILRENGRKAHYFAGPVRCRNRRCTIGE